jgi:hypothetical protein
MAQRTQVIIFNNFTSSTLLLESNDVGGQWTHSSATSQATWFSSPPDTIAPGASVAWGSESKDLPPTPLTLFGAIGSGTGGHVHYSLPAQNGVAGDRDHVFIDWDVPYLGENTIGFIVMLNLALVPGGISKTHQVQWVNHQSEEGSFFSGWQGYPFPGAGLGAFPTGEKHPTDELSLTAIGSASDALTVSFAVPAILSWVSNDPNVARVALNFMAPTPVDVALISDDPAVIGVPPSVKITSSGTVSLNVPQQSGAFTSKTIHLTATYAGQQIKRSVEVVRPENLPLPSLTIEPIGGDDPCSKHFIATTSQSFYVANPNVIHDSTGLTYKWTVTGATAPQPTNPL